MNINIGHYINIFSFLYIYINCILSADFHMSTKNNRVCLYMFNYSIETSEFNVTTVVMV